MADPPDRAPTEAHVHLRAADEHVTTTVELATGAGGRIRQVVVSDGDESVELLASPPGDAPPWSSGWGSFPMAPWAGRIRNGRFSFLGTVVRLEINHDDGGVSGGAGVHPAEQLPGGPVVGRDRRRHSIHGTTFTRPWHIDRVDESSAELSCRLDGALGWTFGGLARQRITVAPRRLTCMLSVESDGRPFPAAIGWHPWFIAPEQLETHPVAMYELDEVAMPTGRLESVTAGPWDNCFVNHEPVVLRYRRDLAEALTVSSDCDHLVIYDRPSHATCVEPQSGPPDAPNVRPDVVEPGHPLRRTMTWTW